MNKRYIIIQVGESRTFDGKATQKCLLQDVEGNLVSKYYPAGVRKVGDTIILQDSTYKFIDDAGLEQTMPCKKHIAVLDDATITAMESGHKSLSAIAQRLTF